MHCITCPQPARCDLFGLCQSYARAELDAGPRLEHACPKCRVVYFEVQECDWCPGQIATARAARPEARHA